MSIDVVADRDIELAEAAGDLRDSDESDDDDN
jgi:hypothetical protein